PVPKIASTITSASAIAVESSTRVDSLSATWTSAPVPTRASQFWRASSVLILSGEVKRITTTGQLAERYLAATNPSPPLLPPPQTTHTRLAEPYLERTNSATPLPAFSISCFTPSPYPEAPLSSSPIPSGVMYSKRRSPEGSRGESALSTIARPPARSQDESQRRREARLGLADDDGQADDADGRERPG